MGVSGRRDQELLEDNSPHYKIILPHISRFTAKIALNSHQRNQCCSAAFTRLVLNENFYVPRATSTIKSAILKCDACKLARSANEKLEPPTDNINMHNYIDILGSGYPWSRYVNLGSQIILERPNGQCRRLGSEADT